jgi:hypothetical protein
MQVSDIYLTIPEKKNTSHDSLWHRHYKTVLQAELLIAHLISYVGCSEYNATYFFF